MRKKLLIERKSALSPVEMSQEQEGIFAGYASIFGLVDSQRDLVKRGAFRETIAGREKRIPLLWQHRTDEPIGVITRLFEDSIGLYVEGRLLTRLRQGREAHALLKAGALKGLSIGYTPKRYSLNPESGVRTLLAVDLWEISLVTFPANARAGVTVVKSADPMEALYRSIAQAVDIIT